MIFLLMITYNIIRKEKKCYYYSTSKPAYQKINKFYKTSTFANYCNKSF